MPREFSTLHLRQTVPVLHVALPQVAPSCRHVSGLLAGYRHISTGRQEPYQLPAMWVLVGNRIDHPLSHASRTSSEAFHVHTWDTRLSDRPRPTPDRSDLHRSDLG